VNTKARRLLVGATVSLAALAVGACGSGGDGGASGPAAGAGRFEGRGPITYVAGKDPSGTVPRLVDRWNTDHPSEKVTFVELSSEADAQRQQMIQNAETKSDAYTVLSLDVVWTSEFAAHRWIDELPADRVPLDRMLPPVVETAKYHGRVYALPASSDGGMLYYRTDLLKKAGIEKPPTTWAEMKADCDKVQARPDAKGMSCFAGQYEKYEGLTVNVAEAVNSGGGIVTDTNGKANVDTQEAKKGLDFLIEGFKSGLIPKEAITYQEEPGRQAFQNGKLVFHRQWPYQFSLANNTDGSSKVAGKFAVAPLPGIDGPGASSLGGHNLALSSFAKNKATALDFMKFFANEANQRLFMTENSLAPTYASLYDDAELVKKFPYIPVLKQSILHAVPRPRVVRYGEVTAAIQDAGYAALTGAKSSEQALADLQKKLEVLTQQ